MPLELSELISSSTGERFSWRVTANRRSNKCVSGTQAGTYPTAPDAMHAPRKAKQPGKEEEVKRWGEGGGEEGRRRSLEAEERGEGARVRQGVGWRESSSAWVGGCVGAGRRATGGRVRRREGGGGALLS